MTMTMATTVTMTMTITMTDYVYSTKTSSRSCYWPATGSVLSSVRQHQLVHIVRAKKQTLLGDMIEVTFIILCEANDASSNPMRQITHSHSSSKHKLCLQRRPTNHAGQQSAATRGLSTVPRPHNNSTKQTAMLHVSSVMPILPHTVFSQRNWLDWASHMRSPSHKVLSQSAPKLSQ